MAKQPTKREIENTLNFVLDELIRHLDAPKEVGNLKNLIEQDGWIYELPFPNGQPRIIGKTAYNRLSDLARAIVASDDRLTGRLRADPLFKVLSEELGRALWNREEIEEREFVEQCVQKAVSQNISSREFFIPCIAPYYGNMIKFRIGSVTFIDKFNFFKNNSDKIHAFKSFEFSEYEKFYRVQNWVAHVRVDGIDKENSEERAFLCVRLAIASVKAKMQTGQAKWLGTEKQSMPELMHYSLTFEPDGDKPSNISLGWGRQFILNGTNEPVQTPLIGLIPHVVCSFWRVSRSNRKSRTMELSGVKNRDCTDMVGYWKQPD